MLNQWKIPCELKEVLRKRVVQTEWWSEEAEEWRVRFRCYRQEVLER
jgi:hypothetical protein